MQNSFQYEQQAYAGEPVPDGLSFTDSMMYIALRFLYQSYKAGNMTKEDAMADKQVLVSNYSNYKFKEILHDYNHTMILLTEEARERFRKNPTVENAKIMADVFDGVLRSIPKNDEGDCDQK